MNKTEAGDCFIVDQGSLDDIVSRGYDLSKLVKSSEAAPATLSVTETSSSESSPPTDDNNNTIESLVSEELPPSPAGMTVEAENITVENKSAVKKLMTVEEKGEGAIGWPIYREYIKASRNTALIALIVLSFALANTSQIGQQWLVAAWTSDLDYRKRPMAVYLGGISVMAMSVAVFNWARVFIAYILGSEASKRLHYQMIGRVLRAPLSFFESTPVGRLVQRFSKDLDSIDQQLPGSFGQLIASALNIIFALGAICTVTPSFSVLMVPVLWMYYGITNHYRAVARDLKRLESISRSPIFAHFSETIGGLAVIRTFSRQRLFQVSRRIDGRLHVMNLGNQRLNEVKLDDNIAAYFGLKAVDRWLSVRLEILGNSIVLMSSIFALLSGSRAGLGVFLLFSSVLS